MLCKKLLVYHEFKLCLLECSRQAFFSPKYFWSALNPWMRSPGIWRADSTGVFIHSPVEEHLGSFQFGAAVNNAALNIYMGFSGGASDKEPICQCRRYKRCVFNPCVGKILWRRALQPFLQWRILRILSWRIPWTEGPGGLQSIGLHRIRHDWSDLACKHLHGLPWWLSGQESIFNAGDVSSIPGSRRFPWRRKCNPLRYSCLGNSMDRGAWWATRSMGSQKRRTWLSD